MLGDQGAQRAGMGSISGTLTIEFMGGSLVRQDIHVEKDEAEAAAGEKPSSQYFPNRQASIVRIFLRQSWEG
jgi:hypothetical protein